MLGLKGHQGALHESAQKSVSVAQAQQFAGVEADTRQELDKDLGRLEVPRYWGSADLRNLAKARRRAGLFGIGMVERDCTIGETQTRERRRSINPIAPDAKRFFAKAVREHWGMENRLR